MTPPSDAQRARDAACLEGLVRDLPDQPGTPNALKREATGRKPNGKRSRTAQRALERGQRSGIAKIWPMGITIRRITMWVSQPHRKGPRAGRKRSRKS